MFVQPITVGFSIATLFCVVGLLYCRSGKKRPPALRSLELSFFCLALLYGAVIYATIEISPLGAYHRWVTVAAALFSSIFLHQFFLLFGDPVQKKWYQLVLLIEMLIAIAISALFTFRTFDSVRFFRFSGHYWDLDAVGEGRIVAAFLLLLNIALIGTGIWQAFRTEGKRRFALIASLLASVFLVTIPLIFLAALRLGNITGYTFGIAMVISVTAGFFLFFVFFVSYSDFAVSLSMRILTVVLGLGLCVGQIMTVSLNRALDREYISRGFEFLARSEVGETPEAGRMSPHLVSPDQMRYIGPLIPVSEQFLGSLHSHDPLPGDGGADVGSRRALPQVQESELPGALQWYFGREGDELQVVFRDPENNRELRLAYVGYRSFLEQHLLQWILLLFLSYLIISIGLVFFLRATLITPVRALLSGVDQVQAGDLEARVPTASSDELGALATAFNAMVNSVRETREELKQYTSTLERTILEGDSVYDATPEKRILDGKSLIYASRTMHAAIERVERIAKRQQPVLITGETGTGKELVAALLHKEGKPPGAPFVPINCAAVPVSLWESQIFGHVRGAFTDAKSDNAGMVAEASGGTLFFDEVGEMPAEIQPKILRLLQEGKYKRLGSRTELKADCRILFATHRDLKAMVEAGDFREDLYYRINVFEIRIPPLRERPSDIPPLVRGFLEKYSEQMEMEVPVLADEAMHLLVQHSWPGNIRELENCIIRIMANLDTDRIESSDLPEFLMQKSVNGTMKPESGGISSNGFGFEAQIELYSRRLIESALQQGGGNKSEAARILGISRGKLQYQMRHLGMD